MNYLMRMEEKSRAQRSKYKTSVLDGLRQEEPTSNKQMNEEKKKSLSGPHK